METMNDPYYTLIIPPVPGEHRTMWHPDNEQSEALSRGAFPSPSAAITWARDRLGGTPYSIKRVDPSD